MKKYIKYFVIAYFSICFIFIISIIIKNILDETPDFTRTYDVVELGADGSDELDDTVFIQQALDKAKEAIVEKNKTLTKVFIKEGTYYVNTTLKIYSDTYLILDNDTRIVYRGTGNFMESAHVDSNGNICVAQDTTRLDGGLSDECNIGGYRQWKNIVIDGGIWDYNKSKSIELRHGNDLKIMNATFVNSSTHTLNVSATKNVVIDNVVIKDQQTTKKLGSNNEVIHLDSASMAGEPTAFPLDGTPSRDVYIQNCTLDNVLSGIGSHVLYKKDSEMGDNIIIRNNTFNNIGYIAINLFSHKNVEIYNNQAYGIKGSYGFLHTYYTGAKVYNNIINNFDSKLIVGANESNENPYKLEIDNEMDKDAVQMYFYVKYLPNGGKGKMESTLVNYGTATKINKNKFYRDGYSFIGWKAHRIYRDDYNCNCDGVGCWLTLKEKKAQNVDFMLYVDESVISRTLSKHRETVEFIAQWKKIKKVTVFQNPDKLNYYQSNTTLDLTGGKVKVIYEDNSVDIVDMNECKVIPFNSKSIGEKTVNISYCGVKTKLKINIMPIQTTSISIDSLPEKLTYYIGEKLDLTGLRIRAVNNDGSVVVTEKDYIYSKIALEKTGLETINVTYGGKSVSFTISVIEKNSEVKYNNNNVEILSEDGKINGQEVTKDKSLFIEVVIVIVGLVIFISLKILNYNRRKNEH